MKAILSLPGVGQHPALLFLYAWDLETDKRRGGKKSVKATCFFFFFFFFIEGDFSQKLMREKEIKVSRSSAGGHGRADCPQEDTDFFVQTGVMTMITLASVTQLLTRARL